MSSLPRYHEQILRDLWRNNPNNPVIGVLKEMEEETTLRGLRAFLVYELQTIFREYHYSYFEKKPECVVFHIFVEMLTRMDSHNQKSNFSALCDLYSHLLSKYKNNLKEMFIMDCLISFAELVRIAQDFGSQSSKYCVRLVKECGKALDVSSEFFMKRAHPSQLEYLLHCCYAERWHDFEVLSSNFLMAYLRMREVRSSLLLKYGFPYKFDQDYYRSNCCFQLERMSINGIHLYNSIENGIYTRGSLRLQLAIELLFVLFSDLSNDNDKEVLGMVWKAVPFPFVSRNEMFALLKPFFFNEAKLRDVCEEYARGNTVFPVPKATQPRSLVHLARVQVRKQLTLARNISDESIDSLMSIPKLIKGYLKLDSF